MATTATASTSTMAKTTTTTTSVDAVSRVEILEAKAIVPDVMFSSVETFFQQLDAVPADTDSLVVGHMSVSSFRKVQAERDRRGRGFRFFFLPDHACVVVTIPTGRHEKAHSAIYTLVVFAIRDMGLYSQWEMHQATNYDALGGASAEGDSSGGPEQRSQYNSQVWPTLVIEAGASQTLPSLRMKAQWWFTASNYNIKVVVLVKLFSAAFRIEIEQWVTAVAGPQRQGATTTRASRAATVGHAEMKQQVSISWAGPSPFPQTPLDHRAPTDFQVEGAPFVLRFQDLMERPPVPAAGEQDIVLSEADLQDVAMRVWR